MLYQGRIQKFWKGGGKTQNFWNSGYLLKGQSRQVLAQESADLYKDRWCHHVNIFEVEKLVDDVIILKLIVTLSYGEVSGLCAVHSQIA